MSIIQQKLSLYHWKFGSHPTREQGIKALIDFECRKSGFLREMTEYFCARELKELIAIDPWGSAIRFDFDRSIPLISSAGADKVFDTKDDIVASIFADGISIHCTTYLIDSGIFECTQNHSK
jgi:hypothetical protein